MPADQGGRSTTLKQRVIRAGGWTMVSFGLSQVLRFGSNLLMTRLLAPEMFGVMAIATMVLYGLMLFSDVGLRQNVVQSKRGNDKDFLNTVWVIQILRGILLWALALLASVLVAWAIRAGMVPANSVYAEPSLPSVIAVVSISIFIMGFDSTKLLEASRNLMLGRVAQIELSSQIFGMMALIGWVLVDRSIWALVAGGLCATLLKTILSHAWLPGVKNRWQWDAKAFREIINFGKWVFVSSILGFLVNNGDRLLLGGMVSSTVLGVYAIAYLLFHTVEQMLSRIISAVSLSALSEIVRERPAELKAGYYRFHGTIASVAYFCAGVLMISGQELVSLLYDARYQQAGRILEVLSIALLAIPFRVAMQCFMALGIPRLFTYIITVQVVTLFTGLPIGFRYFGLDGALWAIVLSYLSTLPIIIFYKVKFKLLDWRKELTFSLVVVIGTIVGGLAKALIA